MNGISFALSPVDLQRWVEFHNANAQSARHQRRQLIFISIFLALVITLVFHRNSPFVQMVALGAFYALALFVFIQASRRGNERRSSRKHFVETGNHSLFSERTLTVDPSGLSLESEFFSTIWKWPSVQRVAVSPDYIYVYVAAMHSLVVPKSAFGSNGSIDDFISAIRTNAPSASIDQVASPTRHSKAAVIGLAVVGVILLILNADLNFEDGHSSLSPSGRYAAALSSIAAPDTLVILSAYRLPPGSDTTRYEDYLNTNANRPVFEFSFVPHGPVSGRGTHILWPSDTLVVFCYTEGGSTKRYVEMAFMTGKVTYDQSMPCGLLP